MPHDDRRGQPAGGGILAGDVVFDEPDSQQVQPEERRDEPADQCGNAHISPHPQPTPVPGRGHQAGKTPRPATAGSGTMCPPKAVTTATNRNPVPCYAPGSRRGRLHTGRQPGWLHYTARCPAGPAGPLPGSQRGRAAAEPVISRRMDTLTPLPDSSAVRHAFMIHPPGPCRRRRGRARRRPPEPRRSPTSGLSGSW
jgi:hypothetical protein